MVLKLINGFMFCLFLLMSVWWRVCEFVKSEEWFVCDDDKVFFWVELIGGA